MALGPRKLWAILSRHHAAAWAWNFGDGASGSTQQIPSHAFTSLGTATITLTAYTDVGAGRASGQVTVTNGIVALFSATPLTGTKPTTVTFSDESITTEGTINAWQWDFGDGATSTEQTPTHYYALPGAYDVTLTASTGVYTDSEYKPDYIVIGPNRRTTITYTYDGLNRLTKATSTGAVSNTFEYVYDAVGNRTTQTATITNTQVTNYVCDAANRLTSVNGQAYAWDDNGNLVNDGVKTFTYDQANRLTNISAAGLAWSATYNGEGARVRQVSNGSVTTYTLDLAAPLVQVLVAKDSSGETRYLYGVTRIGEQQVGGWVYHLSDALGSLRQLADGSGNVVLARGYSPYGEPLWMNGTASSRYAFTGEDYDQSVELLFLRARYVQPRLGMFLTRDPWDGDMLQPQSMSGWGYVKGNPINATDPSGLCSPNWCKPNTVAWVQNSAGGLALRGWAGLQSSIIQRMADGTPVWIDSGFYFADNILWRHVTLANQRNVSGFAAEWRSGTDYLTDKEPQPPRPEPGSVPDWGLVFNNAGYKKGWGLAQHGAYPGMDLVSAIDAANPTATSAGISSDEACDERTEIDPGVLATKGRTVYAVSGGTIVWSGWDHTSANCFGGNCPNQKDGEGIGIQSVVGENTFVIEYHHIVLASVKNTVTAGQPIGYYTQRGISSVPHLHIRVRQNGADIEPYSW